MGQGPGFTKVSQAFATRVAKILGGNRRRIVLNWASRVGALPAFRSRPELDLATVLHDVPPLFDDILELVASGGDDGTTFDLGRVRERAVAHAKHRNSLGFRAADIVTEKLLLRHTIWDELHTHIAELNPTPADILALEMLINNILDTVIIQTLESFEEMTPPT